MQDGIFPDGKIASVRLRLGCILEVARSKAFANFCVIGTTAFDRNVEPLQVLFQLRTDRDSSRESFEVQAMRMAPFCRLAATLKESIVDCPTDQLNIAKVRSETDRSKV